MKGFAVPRKKETPSVVVFDRVGRKNYSTGIDNVGVERDFNRLDIEGVDIDAFEKKMSEFESELAPALRRIIQAETLENADDRAILLNFIGLLFMRNSRLRENFRGFHEQLAKVIMNLALATPERWEGQVKQAKAAGYINPDADANYERTKAFIDGGRYKVDVSTNHHIATEMNTF